jgi:hypothetical protein
MQEYNARIAEEKRKRCEKYLAEVLPVLTQKKVATVVAEYSGEGDSGGVDLLAFQTAKGKRITVDKAVEEVLYELIDSYLPSGFEVNEGGHGVATLDVATGKVKVEHNQRFESYHSSTSEDYI